ncbi:MAG TPA: hypothetical protein VEJ87_08500, partial [Acidimicrobiales bacterium]|nr:hypothetical protein [Acidimicrobiales bacterium]
TLLLLPSAAVAARLRFTGIEGTSTNKADVTAAGQLLGTTSSPSSFYSPSYQFVAIYESSTADGIWLAPAGQALVVTQHPSRHLLQPHARP